MTDTQELVRLLGTRFIQRRDVKAFQAEDGAWYPTREPMTMADFQAHFSGSKTMGHYLLDQDNNCKLFAFDLDLVKHNRDCTGGGCKGCESILLGDDGVQYSGIPRNVWPNDEHPLGRQLTKDLRAMAEGLCWTIIDLFEMEFPVAIATSGNKGLHVYAFTGTISAEVARASALSVLKNFSSVLEPFRGDNFWRHKTEYLSLDIEVFPKQTSLDGKDLGNLMSLPLGVNQVTKRTKRFLTSKSSQDQLVEKDPVEVLSGDNPWD